MRSAELMLLVWFAPIMALTMTWMVTHAIGLLQYKKRNKEASKLALAAWIISAGSGFTGPLVFLGALLSDVLALIELFRIARGRAPEGSRIPCYVTLISSIIMIALVAFLFFGFVPAYQSGIMSA